MEKNEGQSGVPGAGAGAGAGGFGEAEKFSESIFRPSQAQAQLCSTDRITQTVAASD